MTQKSYKEYSKLIPYDVFLPLFEHQYVWFKGERVKINKSKRLSTFKNWRWCARCGNEILYFRFEKCRKFNPWDNNDNGNFALHVNAYGRKNGNLMMFTSDHVYPFCISRNNRQENRVPMCAKCNHKKDNRTTINLPFLSPIKLGTPIIKKYLELPKNKKIKGSDGFRDIYMNLK